jgi:hypothetical protein
MCMVAWVARSALALGVLSLYRAILMSPKLVVRRTPDAFSELAPAMALLLLGELEESCLKIFLSLSMVVASDCTGRRDCEQKG